MIGSKDKYNTIIGDLRLYDQDYCLDKHDLSF